MLPPFSSVRRPSSRLRHQSRARRRQRTWVSEGLEARVLLSQPNEGRFKAGGIGDASALPRR